MGGAIGDGANSETLSLAYLHQGRNFTEGSADGNKENWAVGWLGAALLCKGEPMPLPLWASIHMGMSGLLV